MTEEKSWMFVCLTMRNGKNPWFIYREWRLITSLLVLANNLKFCMGKRSNLVRYIHDLCEHTHTFILMDLVYLITHLVQKINYKYNL